MKLEIDTKRTSKTSINPNLNGGDKTACTTATDVSEIDINSSNKLKLGDDGPTKSNGIGGGLKLGGIKAFGGTSGRKSKMQERMALAKSKMNLGIGL